MSLGVGLRMAVAGEEKNPTIEILAIMSELPHLSEDDIIVHALSLLPEKLREVTVVVRIAESITLVHC